jgi:hypothetical protein
MKRARLTAADFRRVLAARMTPATELEVRVKELEKRLAWLQTTVVELLGYCKKCGMKRGLRHGFARSCPCGRCPKPLYR